MNLLDVRRGRDRVAARHLLDVGLKLTHILSDHLGVDDVALGSDLRGWSGGERHWIEQNQYS